MQNIKRFLSTIFLVLIFNLTPATAKTTNIQRAEMSLTEIVILPKNESPLKEKEENTFENKFQKEFAFSPKKRLIKNRRKSKFSKKGILKKTKKTNLNEKKTIRLIPLSLPLLFSFLMVPGTHQEQMLPQSQSEKLSRIRRIRQFFLKNREKLIFISSITGISILAYVNRKRLGLILQRIRWILMEAFLLKDESIFELLPSHIQDIIRDTEGKKLEEQALTDFFLNAAQLTDAQIREKVIEVLGPNYPDLDGVVEGIIGMLRMVKNEKE